MLRKVVCAVLALVLFTGAGAAADKAEKKKKKAADGAVTGTVKKIDAAAGTLTVTVKSKKTTADREFKIAGTTKYLVVAGKNNRTELAGGLKSDQLKEGATVSVKADADGKATEVVLGAAQKKKKDSK